MRKPSIMADRDRIGSRAILWSVGLVSFVQPSKPNKQEKPADSRASRAMVCDVGGGIGGTGGYPLLLKNLAGCGKTMWACQNFAGPHV